MVVVLGWFVIILAPVFFAVVILSLFDFKPSKRRKKFQIGSDDEDEQEFRQRDSQRASFVQNSDSNSQVLRTKSKSKCQKNLGTKTA